MGGGMKTSELTGASLDWAVAKCEGHDAHHYGGIVRTTMRVVFGPECHYSTDWAQGGPIIEREGISLECRNGDWIASYAGFPSFRHFSYQPLVAAMRCYVASKMGDEIEIPEEVAA